MLVSCVPTSRRAWNPRYATTRAPRRESRVRPRASLRRVTVNHNNPRTPAGRRISKLSVRSGQAGDLGWEWARRSGGRNDHALDVARWGSIRAPEGPSQRSTGRSFVMSARRRRGFRVSVSRWCRHSVYASPTRLRPTKHGPENTPPPWQISFMPTRKSVVLEESVVLEDPRCSRDRATIIEPGFRPGCPRRRARRPRCPRRRRRWRRR